MTKTNRSQQAVLGFLTRGPMSGYDIKRAIEGSIASFWSESYGQIYPVLRLLEAGGLVSCRRDRTGGGRPRNVYSITDPGRARLREWLSQPTVPGRIRHEELLKLFFGHEVEPEDNLRRIRDYRARQIQTLDRCRELRERLDAARSRPDPAADLPYWRMTLRYGELEAQWLTKWCDEVLVELRELAAGTEHDEIPASAGPSDTAPDSTADPTSDPR